MNDPHPQAPETQADEPADSRVERLLRPFVEDTMLWPVGIVILAHAIAFMTPVLVMGLRDRRPVFLLALFLMIGMTVVHIGERVRGQGGVGVTGGALLSIWVGAGAAAWLSAHYGLF